MSIATAEITHADASAPAQRAAAWIRLDQAALKQQLDAGTPGLYALTQQHCPHLFAEHPVFVTPAHAEQMRQTIAAVEAVARLPRYQAAAMHDLPAIAQTPLPGAAGVFFGYDFHVGAHGVALIEINTNAGGALLNAALAKAQRACCAPLENLFPALTGSTYADTIAAMFREEWLRARGTRPLRTIAIVDTKPQQQYLYPEFLLFQRLFRRHGWETVIADPAELTFDGHALRYRGLEIDLVYNRLTDFLLAHPDNAAVRAAYLSQATVLTPHPRAWALLANKRNLALLSDAQQLQALEVPPTLQKILLRHIPRTERVSHANAAHLWQRRKTLFFKPLDGYGGRAAYRGDKLTRAVWQHILAGAYVAQALVPPGQLQTSSGATLKFDVRNYVYQGQVQSVAARLYQGQTTNFRTAGGGFAAVYSWAERAPCATG